MVTASIKIVRRSFFEVFWYTHHLFVIFYGCLLFHASGQMIKAISNPTTVTLDGTERSNVDCLKYIEEFGGADALPSNIQSLCTVAGAITFKGPGYINVPKSYWWVGVPVIIYLIDRILRWATRFNPAVVYKAIEHPGPCIELRMRKRGWNQRAGQYVFLQCSELSLFEWHPFTLTSAPEEDYLSVHIRKSGDWTGALMKTVGSHANSKTKKEGKNAELDFQLAVDGPYGTPSDDIFHYKTIVLIGAGVGVTPYASILKSLWYRIKSGQVANEKTKKVYFYWLCSDASVFGWFTDLLREITSDLKSRGATQFLEVRPYLTRFGGRDMIENVAMNFNTEEDIITKLEGVKTNFGRPRFVEDFVEIGEINHATDIGVFFCGPAILSEKLDESCTKANTKLDDNGAGSTFFYNKENF